MAEQNLVNSTDISFCLNAAKESIPLETCQVNSLIRRSLSNKIQVLGVTPPATMTTTSPTLSTSSTASLTTYCIETGSVVESTQCEHSIAGTTIPINTTSTEVLPDVEKCPSLNDSDNDSFDDEDETIVAESLYSAISSAPSNVIILPCPICFESAALQSSSCCAFHCCPSCWRAHISATINDGRIQIPCVRKECNKYLTRESIVNFIRYDSPLHERYLKLYTNANQNPRAKTCPRCSHLYSLDTITPVIKKNSKKIPKQVQCSECSLVWCFRCSAPWHENLTCKQFIKGDKLLLKWIKQKNEDQWNARKCPKCSSFIQRAGGCPHMTCSSCSCEFCYLCGRRYVKIPVIGQHNNKFSMFGCPYNLHPERPWLRRTIRGSIATGIVVASPIIVAGAVAAAVTVLPSIGIYKLVRHARSRRRRHDQELYRLGDGQQILFNHELEQPQRELFNFDLPVGDFNNEEIMRILHQLERLNHTQTNEENNNEVFPFANMDVENLFIEDDKPPSDFRTCPTTPAVDIRKGHSQSLDNLTKINHSTVNRHHSILIEQ